MSEAGNVRQDQTPFQSSLVDEGDERNTRPVLPKLGRRGWMIALIIVLLVILIGGGAFFYAQRASRAQVQYTEDTVNYGTITVTISSSGSLKAGAEYDLNFAIAGQVSEIDVHVGQQVKAGQVLAKLNSPGLQDALTQAQQTRSSDEVAYYDALNSLAGIKNQASTAIAVAADVYNTSKKTQGDLDQLNQVKAQWNAQVQAAQANVDKAYADLLAAQNAVAAAQHNLSNATMTAPASATVAAINGSLWETVGGAGSGGGSAQPFIVLANLGTLTIAAQVNEAAIAYVEVGQPAQFTVSAYPSQIFRAAVASIETIGRVSANVVSYTVNLTVDTGSLNKAHLYPGMTAAVNITTARHIGVLLIRNSAFTFTTTAVRAGAIDRNALLNAPGGQVPGNGNQGNRRIVLELRNGKLIPVLITVGLSDGTFTEVLSGVQAGDKVVVSATGGNFSDLR